MSSDAPSPISAMVNAQTIVLNLKTELIAHAYSDHASPYMRQAILSSLAHAGMFNGDVDAEVAKLMGR